MRSIKVITYNHTKAFRCFFDFRELINDKNYKCKKHGQNEMPHYHRIIVDQDRPSKGEYYQCYQQKYAGDKQNSRIKAEKVK